MEENLYQLYIQHGISIKYTILCMISFHDKMSIFIQHNTSFFNINIT